MQVSVSRIVVLGTGGTIAGRAETAHDNVGYVAGSVAVADLIAGVSAPAGVAVVAEQVAQVDSKDMHSALWLRLALRCHHWLGQPDVRGIVVTHGTDTMEETAWFLQCVLAPAKPVMLTGAMRPATSSAADGPQNLADALTVAAQPGARGVCVVFAGAVHGAHDVTKLHPYRTDAFFSGDAGAVAMVEEARVRQVRPWPAEAALRSAVSLPEPEDWPQVEIVTSHAGAGGSVVDALVAQGIAGIVVAGTGNGSVHQALEAALVRAQARGVAVRRATRCVAGALVPNGAEALAAGAHASAVKARISLILELMR